MNVCRILSAILLIGTYLVPLEAIAATDGLNATTSTGTTVVTFTIPKLIIATSFANIGMGTYTGTGDLNANDDLNIATNYGTAARTYRVTVTGSGTSSAFTVTDGSQTIAYNAYYNKVTGTTGRSALTSGTALTGQTGAATTLASATLNANLSIEMLQANLQAVNAGAYTGTITLVFTPE